MLLFFTTIHLYCGFVDPTDSSLAKQSRNFFDQRKLTQTENEQSNYKVNR